MFLKNIKTIVYENFDSNLINNNKTIIIKINNKYNNKIIIK